MKLSKQTLAILKNFASINNNIVINPGNAISTIANTKDLYATTTVEETFEHKISIYDLSEFLNIFNLFDDPELDFDDEKVTIRENNLVQVYTYSDPEIITTPPEKGIKLPSVEIKTQISKENLSKIQKAAMLMSADSISFSNGSILVKDRNTGNVFSIENSNKYDQNYDLSVAIDKFKMIQDDYEISICSQGLAQFEGAHGIIYALALNQNGTYG